MQATEAKAEVETREPIVLPPAQASEKTQDSPTVAKQDSCCAVPSGRAGRWRPWLIGSAVVVPIALYGGWDWLAATGLATIYAVIVTVLLGCRVAARRREAGRAVAVPAAR